MDLAEFTPRWTESSASERANKDAFLLELCDVLGVPRPDPTTGFFERSPFSPPYEADGPAAGRPRTVTA